MPPSRTRQVRAPQGSQRRPGEPSASLFLLRSWTRHPMRDTERVDAVPRPRHPVLWYVGPLADAKSLVVALPIDLLASTLLNRQARGGVVEAAPAFDSDYWLRHCEGFRVDTPRGSL